MNTAQIDNSINSDIEGIIIWQYDNATRLIATLDIFRNFFKKSTQDLWDGFCGKVVDIDTADDFGLAVWGKVLDLQRPILTISGTQSEISTELYRKLLKGRFSLLNGNASVADYLKYIKSIFGGGVKVTDGNNMSLTFTKTSALVDSELRALVDQAPDAVFIYPAGVRDNNDPTGRMFSCVDLNGRTKAQVLTRYPNIGGLEESSFTWL